VRRKPLWTGRVMARIGLAIHRKPHLVLR
jgi:hypothetical protein